MARITDLLDLDASVETELVMANERYEDLHFENFTLHVKIAELLADNAKLKEQLIDITSVASALNTINRYEHSFASH